jgi:hypothetical protein
LRCRALATVRVGMAGSLQWRTGGRGAAMAAVNTYRVQSRQDRRKPSRHSGWQQLARQAGLAACRHPRQAGRWLRCTHPPTHLRYPMSSSSSRICCAISVGSRCLPSAPHRQGQAEWQAGGREGVGVSSRDLRDQLPGWPRKGPRRTRVVSSANNRQEACCPGGAGLLAHGSRWSKAWTVISGLRGSSYGSSMPAGRAGRREGGSSSGG